MDNALVAAETGLAILYTIPLNFLLLYASTSTNAVSPIFTFVISFSPTSTLTSMLFISATRIISVPAICAVPTTLSPFLTLIELTMPSIGANIEVRAKSFSALANCALTPWICASPLLIDSFAPI